MRRNLPVTDVEYVLKDHETIVSKTDLKGKITYANQEFIDISGFSAEELLGSPHNLVRHPDMPPAAFADMWATLKSGKAWSGLVKNRCKNGNFYWVQANAAPLYENGQLVGYTSIRSKPAREQVEAAQQIYHAINAGSEDILIREGAVIRRSWRTPLSRLGQWSVRAKIMAPHLLLGAMFVPSVLSDGAGTGLRVAGVLGITICAVSAALLVRAVLRPLQSLREDVARMSSGDMAGHIRVDGKDEAGQLAETLRVLQTNVKVLIGQIREATLVVAQGTAGIASGNADLAARTEGQAAALEETAASMNQLTSTVKGNEDNAHRAQAEIATAAQMAGKGGQAVSEVVNKMQLIRESSRRIEEIISVVDDIAFQTNILALNASVEAARAGEQGRGFAVVAAEVRNLAQRSATAAKEIKHLIRDASGHVDDGASSVEQAGQTMEQIVGQVERVALYMSDICSASREQSQGIEQVNQAIIQMDGATQQNAALVEQAAASSAQMRSLAEELARLAACFRLHQAAEGQVLDMPQRASAGNTAPDGAADQRKAA
ncbi:methyl-accepting chemotaxis protein [Massilia agilis]|uniref:Methyl-accepting chemotaxis protein n=1 Tax=Massilia agilis TaxID=1811226 RepID=A0ABT2DGZ1_9BURK|nr:PAS domain-containing methyl-accepting chemotaxis protein [Massilia agilis]MCS0810109.1 methyl-accepting chemotaxis protein [Massilia agilis]